MSGTDGQAPAILVVLLPCDRLDDDNAFRAEREKYRALAAARGWHILEELELAMCPRGVRHPDHLHLEGSAFHRLFDLLTADCSVLLTRPDPSWSPVAPLLDLLRRLARASRLEVLDGAWVPPATERSLATPAERLLSRDVEFPRAMPRLNPRIPTAGIPAADAGRDSDEAAYTPADRPPPGFHFGDVTGLVLGNAGSMPSGVGAMPHGSAVGSLTPRWPDPPAAWRTDPLPHDGLFVRRNNAFGTRPTLGIADLIEQGVLIDQTRIRFDDSSRRTPTASRRRDRAAPSPSATARPPYPIRSRRTTRPPTSSRSPCGPDRRRRRTNRPARRCRSTSSSPST